MSFRSLIVLPDDSAKPILDAIGTASRSLHVKMFIFSDAALVHAVLAARRRGVKVRVMLNPARRSGEADNEETREELSRGGIEVVDSNPDFELTHEKSMVVDEATAFVKSFNWATKNLTETRDYAVVTSHRREVREIADCFDADWQRQSFDPGDGSKLVWCPGGRERIARFIDEAKHTLKLHKLVEGVGGLRILNDVGIKVHKLKHLKLHAKMLLADGVGALVGSINLAPGSLDGRRELAIDVRDDDVVEQLERIVHHDWKHSHPLDLSDQGLLSDLEERADAAARLGLVEVRAGENGKQG